MFIFYDSARSHLNIVVPPEFEGRFRVVILPPRWTSSQLLQKCREARTLMASPAIRIGMRKTCVQQLAWTSSNGEPISCSESGTMSYKKPPNRNVPINVHVSIGTYHRLSTDRLSKIDLLFWMNTLLIWLHTLLNEWLYMYIVVY